MLRATVFISNLLLSSAVVAANPCEGEILRASQKHGVPAGILYAVGLTETGVKGSLQPYALNIEGKAVFAGNRREAVEEFMRARKRGAKLIDLGCMQINHYYHADRFRTLWDMLDPQQNVDYAARFLVELKRRHGTWSMAVARYHAGPNNNPAQKRYLCRVIVNMVATGFGSWTPDAYRYCNPK
ncbi:transglycosylase SLT domain-containing protein [Chelativorans sp. Marseille-P2723]|uniref:transglycosylase SLT domain-containing protein n=1 Tax=Chelativorans sp. Marseille-P2723 TaxID=2709133 RepID=UPI00156DB30F|nr:transglycosylase SLT domain-containing protein [Chelativorans sp. Marseille-P2723]